MAANAETPIGKLSLMKAAYLKAGETSRAEMETYLGSLMDEESEFGALALELVASMAVQEGDVEYARQVFNELRFLANVPEGTVERATQALAALPPAPESAETGEAAAPADLDVPASDTANETPEIPETGPAGSSDGDQP